MKIGRVKERAKVKTIEMMAKKIREREPTAARWQKNDGNKRAVNVAEENKKGGGTKSSRQRMEAPTEVTGRRLEGVQLSFYKNDQLAGGERFFSKSDGKMLLDSGATHSRRRARTWQQWDGATEAAVALAHPSCVSSLEP
jgi:hypothetical protein